ncbi:DUF664 domain-containing protein [Kineococcus gynurae]|uniref:DUF664 domain-containing protein n=1 Tax=Kineococcus gynurae TaxID=452979 RepID=A0ABV5LNY7_9ACTN
MVEGGYFGEVFGRPFPEAMPWMADEAEDNADMWATEEESRDEVVDLYRRVCSHSDATIEALSLSDRGEVPWWRPETRSVTLHRILVHVSTETHRHAGHADVLRELLDGQAGLRLTAPNLPPGDEGWWSTYRAKLQGVADGFRDVGRVTG